MHSNVINGLNQYKRVGVQSAVEFATPHRLIQMLMEGALAKVAAAKGHLARGEIEARGKQISWAISIVDGLRASLDLQQGGEIASNLDALYEYMGKRLVQANLQADAKVLDEVGRLLSEIKAGWDGIGDMPQALATRDQIAQSAAHG